MIDDLIDMQPSGTFYDRVVHLIITEPSLYRKMVRANRLLSIAEHERTHGEALPLPNGTEALVVGIGRDAETKVKSLDGNHLNDKKALQEELQKLRENAKNLGYDLTHQN